MIDDDNPAAATLGASLSVGFSVIMINDADVERTLAESVKAVVVCLNYSALIKLSSYHSSFGSFSSNTIFVLPTHNNDSIAWLAQRGVHEYFVAPVDEATLWAAVQMAINRGVEASWQKLPTIMRDAMVTSRQTLSACFESARLGQPLNLADVNQTCAHIGSAVKDANLSRWLSTVRLHHDYTYRHCMMVCSTLARFAQEIGFRDNDLKLMIIGGILHDVGKAQVPLTILDKPAKLDDAEWAIMGKHPNHSREILLRESEVDSRVVAMAVHHHEKLDGTGYPDGLSGTQISDHTRLMSIVDVFSALVDERAYKPPMSREDALNRMQEFKGHLDLVLVKSFRNFILDDNATGMVAAENKPPIAFKKLVGQPSRPMT